jgi:hypothetical protein
MAVVQKRGIHFEFVGTKLARNQIEASFPTRMLLRAMKAEILDSGNVPFDTICFVATTFPSLQPRSRLLLGYKYTLHPSQLRSNLHTSKPHQT